MVNGKQELQETLEEWNGLFTRRGLKLNLENTEVMHRPSEARARRRTGVEETDSGDSFVYLGGAVCGDGKSEREVEPTSKST